MGIVWELDKKQSPQAFKKKETLIQNVGDIDF
jgi:hypothetical protein